MDIQAIIKAATNQVTGINFAALSATEKRIYEALATEGIVRLNQHNDVIVNPDASFEYVADRIFDNHKKS